MTDNPKQSDGGLLIPFDAFRLTQLAALFGELLVSKARNILDAKLVAARHPAAPILLVKIEGSVLDGDPAAFWRDNADLAALASQALPRQVFMYYAEPEPNRREGFLVAQRGQVLAADDATPDRMPADAAATDWPVARLCQQLRVTPEELADLFPGGPRVEVSLVEPSGDDQALLMTLAGRDGEEPGPDEADPTAGPPVGAAGGEPTATDAAATGRPAPGPGGAPGRRPGAKPQGPNLVEEDVKRRATERAQEVAAQRERANEVQAALRYELDDLGLVVAPKAELSEHGILSPYVCAKVDGDLAEGLPRDLTRQLQGKRTDIAVRVEFLSEVFVENTPLTRAGLEERAQNTAFGTRQLRIMEVLGPRLGYGTLISTGKQHIFVSRKLGEPLPNDLVLSLLDDASPA